jgi:hypothetical protein
MMLRVISSCARFAYGARASVSVPASITSCLRGAKQMPPRPPLINEDDITEAFLKGSGPGGQKIVCQLLWLLSLSTALLHKQLANLSPRTKPHQPSS